jgi:hypothetical protein
MVEQAPLTSMSLSSRKSCRKIEPNKASSVIFHLRQKRRSRERSMGNLESMSIASSIHQMAQALAVSQRVSEERLAGLASCRAPSSNALRWAATWRGSGGEVLRMVHGGQRPPDPLRFILDGDMYRGMKLVKAAFFLPLRDNDNRDLSAEINEVADECFLIFGAWTLAGHFKGVWRMGGGEQRNDTSAASTFLI